MPERKVYAVDVSFTCPVEADSEADAERWAESHTWDLKDELDNARFRARQPRPKEFSGCLAWNGDLETEIT